jgi:hypothetical protein
MIPSKQIIREFDLLMETRKLRQSSGERGRRVQMLGHNVSKRNNVVKNGLLRFLKNIQEFF